MVINLNRTETIHYSCEVPDDFDVSDYAALEDLCTDQNVTDTSREMSAYHAS